MGINVKCLTEVLNRLPHPNAVKGDIFRAYLPERIPLHPTGGPIGKKLKILTFQKVAIGYPSGGQSFEWELDV